MSIIKDALTENDGESFCPLRIAFYIVLGFILLATFIDILTVPADHFLDHAPDWIKAIAQYVTGGGAAIAGKSYVEGKSQ